MSEFGTASSLGQTVITKLATRSAHRRSFSYYPCARAAFAAFLRERESEKPQTILLPAYIGGALAKVPEYSTRYGTRAAGQCFTR
jgi:hypothetical protein